MFADSPTDVPSKVRIGTRKLKGKYYIAEGGFSHVFAVKDTKTKEYFALKRMTCKDEKQLAHAIEEVAVMKRIPAHPHIIDLEGIEISHSEKGVSTVDILMKIMKGGRLIDVMKARTKHFLMEEMLHIFTCVCSGVQHLHNLHIAHRDLKIENVLLDSDTGAEMWKICDFGSCATSSYECTTEDHVLLARENIELNTTPTYRSPEMVNVQVGCIVGDVSGDIWALGCMLYKMAYFRDAFEAGGPAICKAEYNCPVEPPLPAAFQHVLGLCLQLAPGARPVIETLVEHVEMLKSCNSVEMINSCKPCSEMNLKNNVLHSKQQPHSTKPSSRPRTPPTARRPNLPAPLTTQGLPPAKVPDRISPSMAPQSAPSQPATTLLISSPAVSVAAAPAEQGSRSRADSASTHRRTESLPAAPVPARPRSISKSADSGGAYSMEHVAQPGHASSSSDGAVLQETQQRLMSEEADKIHEQLKEIQTQEAALKLKRRTLEGRLVQIYEQQPSLAGPARLVSRGLTAPVSVASTNETPQVDVACFFAGSHDGGSPKNKKNAEARPKFRRSNSLSSAEDFYSGNHQGVDHGPRTPVSHESSTKWPDVVLTLESFESSSPEQSIESSGLAQPQHRPMTTSRSTTLGQQQQQYPTLVRADNSAQAPIINTAQPAAQVNAAAKMQRSHRRSASMSVGGMSIRPLHQQSSTERKSPQAVKEEGNRGQGKPFSLQPPPPPRQSRNDVSTTM